MTPIFMAFLTSAVLLACFCRWAPRLGLVDSPDARRTHVAPTPVGGGICFALATVTALLWIEGGDSIYSGDFAVLQLGGLLLAVMGLLDDRFGLGTHLRLLVYLVVSWALVYQTLDDIHWLYLALLVLSVTWVINLINFMDGIDGFVVTHALCVCVGMVCIANFFSGTAALVSANLVLAAALLPFLWLNWPPAKLFMGDSGSVFLGFYLAGIGLLAYRVESGLAIVWIILMMPFLIDATVTLAFRLVRGISPFKAHTEHAYQRFTRNIGSALPVNLGLLAIHGIWQLPCALWSISGFYSPLFPVIFSAIPSLLLVAYCRRYS